MATTPIAKADFIEGMAKGMAVLQSFDTERQRLNATLAAQRTGLTRAAARRHLLTLAHLGYLETDGSYFWLAAKVLRFSGSYLASARLPRVLQPTLNRLAAQSQQSFSAVVLDGNEVVIVARSGVYGAPSRLLAYGLHLGARLPAHPTSTGRVLLAALPPRRADRLVESLHLAPPDAPHRHAGGPVAAAHCQSAARRLLPGGAGARTGGARIGRAPAQSAGRHHGGIERGGFTQTGRCGKPAARLAAAAAGGRARTSRSALKA